MGRRADSGAGRPYPARGRAPRVSAPQAHHSALEHGEYVRSPAPRGPSRLRLRLDAAGAWTGAAVGGLTTRVTEELQVLTIVTGLHESAGNPHTLTGSVAAHNQSLAQV